MSALENNSRSFIVNLNISGLLETTPMKTTNIKNQSLTVFLAILTFFSPSIAQAACDDEYNLTNKLDICSIQEEMGPSYKVLTNWGTKPEWLNNHQFVFVSNLVGDIYLMDLNKNKVDILTGHFQHSGFTRAHTLPSGDLLLLGPSDGQQPPEDPLTMYDDGQFTGDLWIFEAPFDGTPYPLQREVSYSFLWWQFTKLVNINAWEGVAVSQESNRIVWSDTKTPFYGSNIIETGLNYILKPSNLWKGEIQYNEEGVAIISNAQKIVKKSQLGFVFLEPQNFKGAHDEQLLFEAYGPTSEGSSNTYIYDEWEGIAPDYHQAFVEVDANANNFSGPSAVKLHLYDFTTKTLSPFIEFSNPNINEYFFVHEPVFSPDGNHVLMTTASHFGNEFNGPGYGIGTILVDL